MLITKKLHIFRNFSLLFSQCFPENTVEQAQVYDPIVFVQVPLFRQGDDTHSFMSRNINS